MLPSSIRVPPSGFWSITLPRSSAVPTPVWTSAWKPWSSIFLTASFRSNPITFGTATWVVLSSSWIWV